MIFELSTEFRMAQTHSIGDIGNTILAAFMIAQHCRCAGGRIARPMNRFLRFKGRTHAVKDRVEERRFDGSGGVSRRVT